MGVKSFKSFETKDWTKPVSEGGLRRKSQKEVSEGSLRRRSQKAGS